MCMLILLMCTITVCCTFQVSVWELDVDDMVATQQQIKRDEQARKNSPKDQKIKVEIKKKYMKLVREVAEQSVPSITHIEHCLIEGEDVPNGLLALCS